MDGWMKHSRVSHKMRTKEGRRVERARKEEVKGFECRVKRGPFCRKPQAHRAQRRHKRAVAGERV